MDELIYTPWNSIPFLPKPTFRDSGKPFPGLSPNAEMVPVVQESGLVVGKSTRELVHGGSRLLHPVVHLHLMDRTGRIYLQKRSSRKDLLPGYWDTAVGGHVDFGESIVEALMREAGEELRLVDFNPIYLERYVWSNERERELVHVFAAIGSFSPRPDPAEIEEGAWLTPEQVNEYFEKKVLTPNFEAEYTRLRNKLEALL